MGPMLRAALPPGVGVTSSRFRRGSAMRQGLGDLAELFRCGRLAFGLAVAVRFAAQTIGDLSSAYDRVVAHYRMRDQGIWPNTPE